jgi:hypothetical protein
MAFRKMLMIFLDGVGIGKNNPEQNPFVRFKYDFFDEYFGGFPTKSNLRITKKYFSMFPVNATLGVPGLPQSGTGQASIFCGVNAAKIIGQHFGPYPYSTLKPIIKEKNIFQTLIDLGLRVNFSNAYPQRFFDYIESGRKSLSVTTLSYLNANQRLSMLEDVLEQKAVTAEITNQIWNEKLGYNLPLNTPQKAGRIFREIGEAFHFNLFEYFLTDHAGHSQDFNFAYHVVSNFVGFLEGILSEFDYQKNMLFIISDHGNIEDLSVRTHTRNPAFCLTVGKHHSDFMMNIKSLKDVKRNIITYVQGE